MKQLNTEPGLVVGLTGGIGSGKSTIANRFKELGVGIVDADVISDEVMLRGTEAYEEIVKYWGKAILNESREIDKGRLGEIVFPKDQPPGVKSAALQRLEAIKHPAIGHEVDRQLQANLRLGNYAILDSPLLLETGGEQRVHYVVTVDVNEATQRKRAEAREDERVAEGKKRRNVDAIIAQQMARTERNERSHFIVNNNGPIEESHRTVATMHFGRFLPMHLTMLGKNDEEPVKTDSSD
ncbi:dephospho-CoA kinase [Candidatus Saccharibacteria bacterium]|nr:dephospho-CoA kinase [Candidatus Saccharibacteria bacterium]